MNHTPITIKHIHAKKKLPRPRVLFAVVAILIGVSAAVITTIIDLPQVLGLAGARAPAPVLYYGFDEISGTTAFDKTSNANNATLAASTATPSRQTTEFCVYGRCLFFDGSNDYLSRTYSSDTELDPASGNVSISFWMNHVSSISGTDTILARADGINGVGYKIYMNSTGNVCIGFDTSAGSFPSDSLCTTNAFANSKWTHIEVVKTGTTSLQIYVNGQLDVTDNSITSGSISGTSSPLYVGIDVDGTSNPWHGYLDEIKITMNASTAEQVNLTYLSRGTSTGVGVKAGEETVTTVPSDGLVSWWKHDETGGGARADSGGNNNLLSDTNAVGSGNGVFNNATDIEGSSSENLYISDASQNGLQLGNTFTISTWVSFETLGSTSTNEQPIVSKGNFATSDMSYALVQRGNSGNTSIRGYISSGGTTYDLTHTATYALTTDTWYYVTWTYDGATSRIYVNGTEVSNTAYTGTPFNDSQNFYIGHTKDQYFDGDVDETRVYSKALIAEEVTDLYNWTFPILAYWNFDEGSGTTVFDQSGNGFNGTIAGDSTAPTWTTGQFGSGLDFDGSDDVVTVTDTAALQLTGAMTVSAWVYDDTANNGRIIAKQGGSGVRAFTLNTESGTNNYSFGVASNSTTMVTVESVTTIITGRWVHVAGVYVPGQALRIYINGVLDNENTTSIPSSQYNTNGQNILFGQRNGCTNCDWDGKIDEIRLYNYARTDDQIQEDYVATVPSVNGTYTAGFPKDALVAHWKFDEGSGTTAYNSSENGSLLNGTMSNFSAPFTSTSGWAQSGKIGKALNFDGSDDVVNVGSDLSIDNMSTVSVCAWIYPRSAGESSLGRIFHKGSSTDLRAEFRFDTDATNALGFSMGRATTNAEAITNANPVPLNTWSRVCATYEEGDGGPRIYVNGNEVASYFTRTDGSGAFDNDATESGYIGNRGAGDRTFDGLIDEVRIYNIALDSQQLKNDLSEAKSMVWGGTSTDSGSAATSFSYSREFCVPGDSATCNPPIAEWSFDENTGTTLNDISGNNNTGTLTGSPLWARGKKGAGLAFDNDTQYVNVGSNSVLDNLTAVSVSAWIYPTSFASYYRIMDKDSGLAGWGIHVCNGGSYCNGNTIAIVAKSTSGTTFGRWSGDNNIISQNNWNHITVTWDRSSLSNDPRIYVNGVESAVTEWTTPSGAYSNDAASNLYIGNNHTPDRGFRGTLDSIRVYNYVRTPAQVVWEYNKGGPLGWWKLDECTGTTAYDASGNGLNGTITIDATGTYTSAGTCSSGTGTHAWNAGTTGKFGSALAFDGTDDVISVPDSSAVDLTDQATFMAWVKLDVNNDTQNIFQKDVSGNRGYAFYITNTGKVAMFVYSNVIGNTTLNTGEWYHVAAVKDGANVTIYVNGKPDGTGTLTSSIPNSTLNLGIGGRPSDNADIFDGLIDDARIYRFPMTEQQLKVAMNEGAALRFGPN
jgi:hypothetical protein